MRMFFGTHRTRQSAIPANDAEIFLRLLKCHATEQPFPPLRPQRAALADQVSCLRHDEICFFLTRRVDGTKIPSRSSLASLYHLLGPRSLEFILFFTVGHAAVRRGNGYFSRKPAARPSMPRIRPCFYRHSGAGVSSHATVLASQNSTRDGFIMYRYLAGKLPRCVIFCDNTNRAGNVDSPPR
jgi:hypothetical protein